jgi:hypothetical protein
MFRVLLVVFALFFNHQAWSLDKQDFERIAEKIEQNETGGQDRFLVFWSEAEEFPSLGIGHFIWLPKGLDVPFEPTFYPMVKFVSKTHPAPEWIRHPNAPWANKAEFDREGESTRVQALRQWLKQTKTQQAEFIVQRFNQRMNALVEEMEDPIILANYRRLIQSSSGQFALMDYANFKGFGNQKHERYQGEGWGLIQVLADMSPRKNPYCAVAAFAQSAEKVLTRRVELAPIERNEARWLPGWKKRLSGYQDFTAEHCKELN